MNRLHRISVSLCLLAAMAAASSKPAKPQANIVDQGTFGIFQGGRRVATETFIIRQLPDSSITSSQLHSENGGQEQSSELTLHLDGTLARYEWKQIAPTRNSATVEVNDQFLSMHAVIDGKSTDQSFFLTPDVFVLDDYFFAAREVLLWRYLASACKPHVSDDGCDIARTRYPVLIPRRRTSDQVFLELKGYDDTPLNGRPQHLRHFVMQTDGPEWHLWLDSNHKLLRISIPEANTEVLRQEN